jgi:TfoX/Sxy family transcriptional regulator of competence genes
MALKMPKADGETETFFRTLLPVREEIVVKPMFGQTAAFVNGNLFAGIFGKQVFVRLSEEDGTVLMKENGASHFAPMEGRPMRGYIVMPSSWTKEPKKARSWVAKSLGWVSAMPSKAKKS